MDSNEAISFILQLLDKVLPFFEEESETVTLATRNNLKSVLELSINSEMVNEALHSDSAIFNQIVSRLVNSLNFKNRSNLDLVIQTQTVLFEKCKEHSIPLLQSLLIGMDQLYATRDFHFQSALKETLGFALKHMGPEQFFKAIPFKEEGVPRQWLIQLLRNNVIHSRLGYFQDTLIPDADQVLEESKMLEEEENMPMHAKHLRTLYEQIWDTFVAFCQYPIDIKQIFPTLQSELQLKLNEDTVCHSVCLGLVKLIESNQNIINENQIPDIVNLDKDEAEENLNTLSESSQMFLSELFQLHHKDLESKRPLIRQSIDAIASITPSQVLSEEFKRLMISVLKTAVQDDIDKQEKAQQKQHRDSAMEIALTLVKHLPADSMDLLFQVIQPQLSESDTALQKRSYKALEFICQYHPQYVEQNVEPIVNAFVSSLQSCSPAANRRRILGLWHLSERLNGEMFERFINEFIVEIVLATKDNNNKTRAAAYDILLSLANHWLVNANADGQNKTLALEKFYGKIVAGLGGNTAHMISATINSITRLFYSYPKETKQFSSELLESILTLLKNPSKEIALSVLGFTKIALKYLSTQELHPFLNNLMNNILLHTSKEKSPGSIKNRCRVVTERLIRKFGFDDVKEVTPEKHYPFISNIRKTFNRMQKKKKNMNEEELKIAKEKMALSQGRTPFKDGTVNKEHVDFENELFEDEGEEVLLPKKGRKSLMRELGKARKQNHQKDMWIVDEEDDPMDLADPSAMGQFTGQKPNQKQEQDSGFEIAEDGRMVIVDEEEEQEKQQKQKQEDDSEQQNRGKKRKLDETQDENKNNEDSQQMELDDEEQDPVKYAAEQKIKKKRRMNTGEAKVTSGSTLLNKKKKKKKQEQLLDHKLTGEKFRNKKAGGDTKRKGDLDPFAYVPLDPRYMNRRNKQKSLKRFGMVVNKKQKKK